MDPIRKAELKDVSRIAEILIFTKRTQYRPIFNDDQVSFGEMQVLPTAREYLDHPEKLEGIWVYDEGFVKGLIHVEGTEIKELYVDPFFQGEGIGGKLMTFAVETFGAQSLWVLEKNESALGFYRAKGFSPSGERELEEGTPEYKLRMVRGG